MKSLIILVFFAVIYLVSCKFLQSHVVETTQGPVRGYTYKNDPDVYVFYGIPYATAPTGQDKFKAPLAPPVWSEPLDAVNDAIVCPQHSVAFTFSSDTKNMTEDCLIVNIYMPISSDKNLPVVVLFHGGAFTLGHGSLADNEYLVKTKQVVVVTFNHRLGAHGFLCLGTKSIPGNAGMKDQVALLRWVNKNIGSFGGNSDEIVLQGFNTGATSIDLLIMSKMAKGLFKRAIIEGGASTAPSSVQFDPIENGKKFAELLKFENVDNFQELEEFYKNISYEELNSKHSLARPDSTYLMSPCVERDLEEEMFLDDNPINLLKTGSFEKIPIMFGFGEADGKSRLPFLSYWEYFMNIRFLEFLPADLKFKSIHEKFKIAEKIQSFYFKDKTIGKETQTEFVDFFTDVMFAYPALRAVTLQVEAGNDQIYLFETSTNINENPYEKYANLSLNECKKVVDELSDYWKKTHEQNKKDSIEVEEIRKPVGEEIVLNFILSGKPVPLESDLTSWSPVGAKCSPHMYISNSLKLRGSLLKKRGRFWKKIYDTYYRYPVAPTPPSDYK